MAETLAASQSRDARPGRRERAPGHFAALDLGTNNCRLLIARPPSAAFGSSTPIRASCGWARGSASPGGCPRRPWSGRSPRSGSAPTRCAAASRCGCAPSPPRPAASAANGAEFLAECGGPNRHLAARHQSARRGAAVGGGLLQPDRPRGRRRAGAGCRRRLDRAGLARPAPAPRRRPRRAADRGVAVDADRCRHAWPSGSRKATAPAGRRGRLVRPDGRGGEARRSPRSPGQSR